MRDRKCVGGYAASVARILAIACALAAPAVGATTSGPGAAIDAPTMVRLKEAMATRAGRYVVRTEHKSPQGAAHFVNRLVEQDSPYLLQHAHNPINWFSWGDAAFAEAKRLGRPILVSVGYSTCHWCHVMERESFDNVALAKFANEHFVSIKVDRERRPDVDAVFIRAAQLLSGRAGWPLTILMTPEGAPFFAGTYLPRAEFLSLLQRVSKHWQEDPKEFRSFGKEVNDVLAQIAVGTGEAQPITAETHKQAIFALASDEDREHGGFGVKQKFPNEPRLLFLLDRALRDGDQQSFAILDRALAVIARSGMHDQVGGGFHRYTVDRTWRIPHFEKMLYNQAQLIRLFAETYALTGRKRYARDARRAVEYLLREMQSDEGLFFSATDADSDGGEGKFFVWGRDELDEVLGPDANMAARALSVTTPGTFNNANVLQLKDAPSPALDSALERMRIAREKREKPLRDDKVITGWNALVISALMRASHALDEPRYRAAALRAGEALWNGHVAQGTLWRTSLHGRRSALGTLEDHAYWALALLDLHDATGAARWRERASQMVSQMTELFWDPESGGFFLSSKSESRHLAVRPKDSHDGALPAANPAAVLAIVRLARRTGDSTLIDRARATIAQFSSSIASQPAAYPTFLRAARELNNGELGRLEYAAKGAIRVTGDLLAQSAQTATFQISLALQPGWHINAAKPLQDHLIGTQVSVASPDWKTGSVTYPAGLQRTLGFQAEPLLLYEGETTITVEAQRIADPPGAGARFATVEVHLQACTDEYCLLPETLQIEIPAVEPTPRIAAVR
ncbi:MAG: DUF255 domain-containing protein [Gammaproteobacteria bacterium]|nr:DUF255 domain-containing protein [Gammaproteobacteria bacterium]